MTEKFIASNGQEIYRGLDGRLVPISNGEMNPGGSFILDWETEKTIREFLQFEEDRIVGRWRIPGGPDEVVIPDPGDPNQIRVESTKGCENEPWTRLQADQILNDCVFGYETAVAYFEAHPAPPPWHNAKPGEVWVITLDEWNQQGAVVTNDKLFAMRDADSDYDLGTYIHSPRITHAVKIWSPGD